VFIGVVAAVNVLCTLVYLVQYTLCLPAVMLPFHSGVTAHFSGPPSLRDMAAPDAVPDALPAGPGSPPGGSLLGGPGTSVDERLLLLPKKQSTVTFESVIELD
jgi:hypothetical protein